MHIQEARNNVFQINFLLPGNLKKNIFRCRQIIIFFQPFFLFLGPMHIQEARNNVFQIIFLLAGNSEKYIFRCRQISIFSSSKIGSDFSYF